MYITLGIYIKIAIDQFLSLILIGLPYLTTFIKGRDASYIFSNQSRNLKTSRIILWQFSILKVSQLVVFIRHFLLNPWQKNGRKKSICQISPKTRLPAKSTPAVSCSKKYVSRNCFETWPFDAVLRGSGFSSEQRAFCWKTFVFACCAKFLKDEQMLAFTQNQ